MLFRKKLIQEGLINQVNKVVKQNNTLSEKSWNLGYLGGSGEGGGEMLLLLFY